MPPPTPSPSRRKLPRLARPWYRGHAAIFWTHTIHDRATGWLSPAFHARFREILVHACARHQLVCPAYVLMPDHWHFVWLGLAEESDQWVANKFLREHIALELLPAKLQSQAHDHVLRDTERTRGALRATCGYIWENPVRAGLAANSADWSLRGGMAAGYPSLTPNQPDYWERFWTIYNRLVTAPTTLPPPRP